MISLSTGSRDQPALRVSTLCLDIPPACSDLSLGAISTGDFFISPRAKPCLRSSIGGMKSSSLKPTAPLFSSSACFERLIPFPLRLKPPHKCIKTSLFIAFKEIIDSI